MKLNERRAWPAAVGGALLGGIFCVLGYLFVRGNQEEFGMVMFVLIPIAAGLLAGAMVGRAARGAACCLCGGLLAVGFLLITGLEGIVCLLMAAPLLALGLTIGALLGNLIRRRWIDRSDAPERNLVLLILLTPFFIAAADHVEKPHRHAETVEEFSSTLIVPTGREETWRLVEKMDRLDGERPFLLRLGIPTPYRCELEKPEIGGTRVCYFREGILAQNITAWDFPRSFEVTITANTLPGRRWLTLKSAAYEFEAVPNGTRITRRSTIGTRLYPRWYWRPLERWGVTSEHEFIFSNLSRWTSRAAPAP
jgi:hypothetical protein